MYNDMKTMLECQINMIKKTEYIEEKKTKTIEQRL